MSNYLSLEEIKVGLNFGDDTLPVGRLASRNSKIYFEYDTTFLARNLNISPLKLPLETGVQTFDPYLFEGLPSVFNDSLPDVRF
ncbi:MAG: HipA N-terminal domain-containing protein [Alphaproteobacteria bacterium]